MIAHNDAYLQIKYLQLISSRLRNFRREGDHYRCACPLCGDSQKKSKSARGYILESDKGPGYYFYCHNCTEAMSLPYFIKRLDEGLYQEYLMELLTNQQETPAQRPKPIQPSPTPRPVVKTSSQGIIRLTRLPPEHPASAYVNSRLIPPDQWDRLWFAPNFRTFVRNNLPEKMEDARDEPRLVIPFVSASNKLVGFQGRLIGTDHGIKYITIRLDSEEPRIFGMDRVNLDDDILVTEGPIDALFLGNAIATAGGSISAELNKLKLQNRNKLVVIYDNEPRSIFTIKKIAKAIESGYRVCIWPESFHQEKDVNEMIKRMVGNERDKIQESCRLLRSIILDNSFSGMEAELKFSGWRKV